MATKQATKQSTGQGTKQTSRRSKPQSGIRAALDPKLLTAAMKNIPRRTLVIWLVAAALGLFLLPLTIVASSLSDEVSALQTDVDDAIAAQTSIPTLQPQVAALFQKLSKTQAQAKEIQAVVPTLAAGRLDLPGVMSIVGNYDANQIQLDGTTWHETQLTLSGRAVDNDAVIAYVNSLESSGKFKSVVLQSVQIQDAQVVTMTVAPNSILPTATITPTATVTPTPSLRDAFEPDESAVPALYLDNVQTHTFYPNGDTDRVTFLAKAGRYYQLGTSNLTPGVDTFLSVDVAGQTYSNDDFKLGSLYSDLIFAAPPQDTEVTITITNRGQFGITQGYDLLILEVPATPTPTLTLTPVVTTAATAAAASGTAVVPTVSVQPTVSVPPTVFVPPTSTPTPTLFVPPTSTPTLFVATLTPTNTPVPPTPTFTPTPVQPTPTDIPAMPPTTVPTIPPTPSFSIVNAGMGVTPQTGTTCPGTFTFSGTLTAMGAGTATYVFERSDGTSTAAQSASFGGDGTIIVSDTWSIAGASGFTFGGWERLRVLAPNSLISNQADMMLVCAPDALPTPSAMNSLPSQNAFSTLGSALPSWLYAVASAPVASQDLPVADSHSVTADQPLNVPNASTAMPIRFVLLIELQVGEP